MKKMDNSEVLAECINIVSDSDRLLSFSGTLLTSIDAYFLSIGRCLEFDSDKYEKMMMAQDNLAHVANLLAYVLRKIDVIEK